MRRLSELLCIVLACMLIGCGEKQILSDGGPDVVVVSPQPRASFKLGAALGSMALLASDFELRAIAADQAPLNRRAANDKQCLDHAIDQLWLPAVEPPLVIASGGATATVLSGLPAIDPMPPHLQLRGPLLNVTVGRDGLIWFTSKIEQEPAPLEAASNCRPTRSAISIDRAGKVQEQLQLAGTWHESQSDLLAGGATGRIVLKLAPQAPVCVSDDVNRGCGITFQETDTCTFYAIGARSGVPCGALPPSPGDEGPQEGTDAGAGPRSDGAPTPLYDSPCAELWSPASVSENGCLVATVNERDGSLFAVPLHREGCPSGNSLWVPGKPVASASVAYEFQLSPRGEYAAIWAGGDGAPRTRIVALATGAVKETEDVAPSSLKFGCDSLQCTLWTYHDGLHGQAPQVSAWAADSGLQRNSCFPTLPVTALAVWSAGEATFSIADQQTYRLSRMHADPSACPEVDLGTEPICIGSSSPQEDYTCSRDSDGEVLVVNWSSPPSVTRRIGFTNDRRLGGADCSSTVKVP